MDSAPRIPGARWCTCTPRCRHDGGTSPAAPCPERDAAQRQARTWRRQGHQHTLEEERWPRDAARDDRKEAGLIAIQGATARRDDYRASHFATVVVIATAAAASISSYVIGSPQRIAPDCFLTIPTIARLSGR
jgi:hypothetical protein